MSAEHVKDVQLTLAQKAMVALATAFALWLGATVYQTAVSVAILLDQNKDRYTGSQAASDKALTDQRFERNEADIVELKKKHGS